MAIPPVQIGSQSELASWLLDWFSGASGDEREAMIHATYGLWLARNEARDGRRIAAPHEIIARVVADMQEWKAVHSYQRQPAMSTPRPRWLVQGQC